MAFSITDIPQADRLDKLILTIRAVHEGAHTDKEIAAAIGFSDRQGRYYRHAAEILDLLTNHRNNAMLTSSGKELAEATNEKVLQLLRKSIYSNKFFRSVLDFFESQNISINEDVFVEYLRKNSDTVDHFTIPRRAKTVLSWLLYLDIIEEDDQGYKINRTTYKPTIIYGNDRISELLTGYVYGSGNKTLLDIEVKNISPNPHNPRILFDPQELDDLKGSIAKVGILVPLTVYRNTKKFPATEYVLLDGERRWRCALELNLPAVPANVIDEPEDVTQNILYMFNIHHYRKAWALFPTALKLEVLIKELQTDNETVLSNFTGVPKQMIRRCKALLWYPEKYRNILMDPDGKVSTDFFIELFPIAYRLSFEAEYSYPDKIQEIIDLCIKKFTEGIHITDVKEFREMRKAMGFFHKSSSFDLFKKKLDVFLNSDVGLEVFISPDIEEEHARKNIIKYSAYLIAALESVNVDIISDLTVEEKLKNLSEKIQNILELID